MILPDRRLFAHEVPAMGAAVVDISLDTAVLE
jgi:hypothetical protein